jgi:hypothetical protein
MTIGVLYHGSRYRYFKNYYNGVVLTLLKQAFPGLPSYGRFIALKPRIFIPLLMFLASHSGRKTGIYYVDATALPVCHNPAHCTAQGVRGAGSAWQDLHGLVLRLQAPPGVQPRT